MALSDSQKWLILAVLVLTGWLLYLLAPVLTPFLISMLLAYLGDPLVDRLERHRLSRTVSVLIVFAGMLLSGFAAVLVLLPALQAQVAVLILNIPTALDWVQQWLLPKMSALFSTGEVSIDVDAVKTALLGHWQEVGSVAKNLMLHIGRSGQLIVGWVTYLLLIPVVTFYLLRDWDILVANVRDLLPRKLEPTVARLAQEIDAVVAEFLRGQLTVMAALGIIYVVGLWLVGLQLAFIVGLLAGVVSFVPYLGVIVGVIVAGLAAVVQFQDLIHLLGVVAVFGVGQILEGMVLSPLLVGDRIGLHPVAVIFAVLAGGQLFGFLGVLLALPVAAVIVVLLRHSKQEYQQSQLYAPVADSADDG
ncbi:MAG TPA: AI-2E family transporter [Gammaproteobacteria bacterium]|nr:AI-2E family transporter [Gammaproteobacteria bacterium]